MSQPNQTTQPDFPYFDEYLQQVLRPRVENAVEATERMLAEAVWAHVLRLVAAEQKRGGDPSPQAMQAMRSMFESKCGLKLHVTLRASWADQDAPADNGHAAPENGAVSGEVVTRRTPGGNPLANAVISGGR